MTNKELFAKLNNLQKYSPDQNWLKNNRELLLSQISNSGAENLPAWKIMLINISSFSKAAAQPAYALAAFVFLLVAGSLLGQNYLASAKPNDSLYIARIIAENVKLTTTFNTEARDRLAVQYATDHAQDISAVLADPKFNTPANSAQVAELNSSFTQEVNTVKSGLSRLAPAPAAAPALLAKTQNSAPTIKNSEAASGSDLIIADSSKDNKGIQLLDKNNVSDSLNLTKDSGLKEGTSATPTLAVSDANLNLGSTGLIASSSAAGTVTDNASSSVATSSTSEADQILEQAQKLFDSKNYNQASDKLKEIDKIIQ